MTVDVCSYVGCKNTSEDNMMFRFPTNDWSKFNLWLLNSGNQTFRTTEEYQNQYICANHFHRSKIKTDTKGKVRLAYEAVPHHYKQINGSHTKGLELKLVAEASNSYHEQSTFFVRKPSKVYVKKKPVIKTYNSKKKEGVVTQSDSKNTESHPNIDSPQTTHIVIKPEDKDTCNTEVKKDERPDVVSNGTLNDTKGSEIANKYDRLNVGNVKVEEEIDDKLESNTQSSELIKNEAATYIQVKIEPTDIETDIKLENECDDPNNVEEFQMQLTNSSCLADSDYNHVPNNDQMCNITVKEEPIDTTDAQTDMECKSELNDTALEDNEHLSIDYRSQEVVTKSYIPTRERIKFAEDVAIKTESSTDDIEMPNATHKPTNIRADTVVDIKKEWVECSDPEIECGSPQVECTSPEVECSEESIECAPDTFNDPQVVELKSDINNPNTYIVVLKNKQDETTFATPLLKKVAKTRPGQTDKTGAGGPGHTGDTGHQCCGAGNTKYHYKYDMQRQKAAGHKESSDRSPKDTEHEDNSDEVFRDDIGYKYEKYMLGRYQKDDKKPFKCSICYKNYKYEFMLTVHMKEHSGTDCHCDICGRKFKSKRGLAKHLNTHTKERVFSCPTCGLSFTERTQLLNHLIKHTPEEKYRCSSCEVTFENSADFKAHISLHRTYFECKVCGRKFAKELELDGHMKEHTKFMECSFCLKQLKDVGELQKHAEMHQVLLEKIQHSSHVCGQCGKRFLYRSLLVAHERIHSAERPFGCDKCPQRFKTSSARNEHARGHKRMHKCSECGKSFARAHTLQLHARIHTGEKPYSCHLCQIAFTQHFSLNYHMKKFHGEVKTRKVKTGKSARGKAKSKEVKS